MKIVALLFAAVFAVCARGAEVATTNVVEYTDAQKNERAARAAATSASRMRRRRGTSP